MLTELRIRNFAIIESLTLPLGPGFNVLTGETGAGKSIIVGALGLLLGERGTSDVVRTGRTTLPGQGSVEPDNPVWVEFANSMAPMMVPIAAAMATAMS